MILKVHSAIRERLGRALEEAFQIPASERPAIVIETPPRRALGNCGGSPGLR